MHLAGFHIFVCMNQFSVSRAVQDDIPALVGLINSAYRGQSSKAGWTTEADLIEGEIRTDSQNLKNDMANPDSVLLAVRAETGGPILGCVYLQKRKNRLYLGMLSVSPALQSRGIGKQLLDAAEEHARLAKCDRIFMTVISVRQELIQWYEKHGYGKTGETAPFPDERKFGIPRQPLEFLVLEKEV